MAEHVTIAALMQRGVLTMGDGYRTKRSEHGRPGHRIVRVADVRDGNVFLDGDDFVSDEYTPQMGAKVAIPGDVLLTTKGTVGRVAVMPVTDEPAVYSPQLCYFRIIDRSVLDPGYLRYWFGSQEFLAQASFLQGNTDMAPYISLSDLRAATITLPSLPEQTSIAAVLGVLDDKIAANTRLALTADELARSIYTQRASGSAVRPMNEVLTPILGGTPARSTAEFWGGSRLWISAKDVTGAGQRLVLDTEEKITDRAVESTKAKPLSKGSVILTARGTVGAVARLGEPASFNQSCYGFEPDVLPAGVLYFAILGATEQAKAMAHGSVFDTITMATFRHLSLPVLSSEDANALEARLAPHLSVVESVSRENRTLAALRDTLLPQLMSGKLRVREAAEMAGL